MRPCSFNKNKIGIKEGVRDLLFINFIKRINFHLYTLSLDFVLVDIAREQLVYPHIFCVIFKSHMKKILLFTHNWDWWADSPSRSDITHLPVLVYVIVSNFYVTNRYFGFGHMDVGADDNNYVAVERTSALWSSISIVQQNGKSENQISWLIWVK